MHRVNRKLPKKGKDGLDVRNIQIFFYYHKGHSLKKTAEKFGLANGHTYNIIHTVEDNFWNDGYKIISCTVGPTKARPEKNWLKIKVGIRQQYGEPFVKTFCYDPDKKGTEILEDYIKEEFMR